jgi:uncharacterized protein YyaL (SSP411 family)
MNTRQQQATISQRRIFDSVLTWSTARDFCGYNKHDGLNSPILMKMLGWSKWSRISAIQLVMRSPWNIRPLLGVRPTYNPKGLGLFIMACTDAWKATGDAGYLAQATALAEKLRELQQPTRSGKAWGYHYPWQDPGFFAEPGTPNAVVTSFANEALIALCNVTGEQRYLEWVSESLPFYFHDLQVLHDTSDELCLSYMPFPMKMKVMDVSILIAAVLAEYGKCSGDNSHLDFAGRLVRFVTNRQTDYGAWYYTDPPGDSHITHDNYHTGFILDALYRYQLATGDSGFSEKYTTGLKFYATRLFEENGAPRWMHNRRYPHDIHGAAQGILTFSRHMQEYPELASKIQSWTIENLYDSSGFFHYQQTRWLTKRFTLMRWCNAWMLRAIGAMMRYKAEHEK